MRDQLASGNQPTSPSDAHLPISRDAFQDRLPPGVQSIASLDTCTSQDTVFSAARVALSLQSLLFWQGVLEEPDPLLPAREAALLRCDSGLFQKLHLATANVTTLRPGQEGDAGEGSARRADLALQFATAGLQVIGVQESRSQYATPRSSGDFWIVPSPASPAGAGGVELWLHNDIISARDKRTVEIIASDPRRLIVRLALDGRWMVVAVLHALDRSHGKEAQGRWWADTASFLRVPRAADVPLVLLADANARVGSELSPAIVDCSAELQCAAGRCFHDLLIEFGLFLPSTFWPGPAATWFAARGAGGGARLDYVAVPLIWAPLISAVGVPSSVHLEIDDKLDHCLTAVC